jgi:galactokinase
MSERIDWERKLAGKTAAGELRMLYGRDKVERHAKRLARLAARLETQQESSPDSTGTSTEYRFYSAPGRVELGGNHTDHNRGKTLCAAVELDAAACAASRSDLVVRIVSEGYADPILVDLRDLEPKDSERGKTEALVRGMARALADRGVRPRGFSCVIHSEVTPGSGLSSSAAIEVLLGTIMADLAGITLDPMDVARAGKYAENEYFGKPCGLMDQAASALGGIIRLDFADPEKPAFRRIDFDFEHHGLVLAVVNTGGSHADLTAEYASIPAEMRAVAAFLGAEYLREVDPAILVSRGPEIRTACGDRALLRAFHFTAENARVTEMAEALESGDLKCFLKLSKQSGRSSWELLQNLYPAAAPAEQGIPLALELSSMYIGRKGAWRVNGGGFAGTIQAFVPEGLWKGYAALMERYFGPGCARRMSVRDRGALRIDL